MKPVDRVKEPLRRFVRLSLREVDYLALYPARVVSQDPSDLSLDLIPDDADLPGVQSIPLRLGLPGVAVKVSAGARVLLGFEGGDPAKPVATLWEAAGLLELQLGVGATELVAMASKVVADLTTLKSTLTAWTPVPGDGGTALKTALTTLFTAWPSPAATIGSTLVKVKATP